MQGVEHAERRLCESYSPGRTVKVVGALFKALYILISISALLDFGSTPTALAATAAGTGRWRRTRGGGGGGIRRRAGHPRQGFRSGTGPQASALPHQLVHLRASVRKRSGHFLRLGREPPLIGLCHPLAFTNPHAITRPLHPSVHVTSPKPFFRRTDLLGRASRDGGVHKPLDLVQLLPNQVVGVLAAANTGRNDLRARSARRRKREAGRGARGAGRGEGKGCGSRRRRASADIRNHRHGFALFRGRWLIPGSGPGCAGVRATPLGTVGNAHQDMALDPDSARG